MKKLCLIALVFAGCHHPIDSSIASFEEPKRLLLLDGDNGSVACRVYGGLMSATIPRFSENKTLESATRSLMRMKNLTAVRGLPGASMVGPADYLGNLESPHQYLYTIQNGFPPLFYRYALEKEERLELEPFDDSMVSVVKAHWIHGGEDLMEKKQVEYHLTPKHLRQSIFPNPGILKISQKIIELKAFDPRNVDLGSFKARLVNHSVPFSITRKPLPPKDEYRLVTYLYEPLYADWQINHGSGLFLEKHHFSQTITPITPQSKGFVTLARASQNPDELELIAIEIPYGYTLIIEEGCIHGDTTLNGFFMMGMTSDHTTMGTANTVFLKYPETKENVIMVLEGSKPSMQPNDIPHPYVIYKEDTDNNRAKFKELTQGKNFIFNPFSREYFHR